MKVILAFVQRKPLIESSSHTIYHWSRIMQVHINLYVINHHTFLIICSKCICFLGCILSIHFRVDIGHIMDTISHEYQLGNFSSNLSEVSTAKDSISAPISYIIKLFCV